MKWLITRGDRVIANVRRTIKMLWIILPLVAFLAFYTIGLTWGQMVSALLYGSVFAGMSLIGHDWIKRRTRRLDHPFTEKRAAFSLVLNGIAIATIFVLAEAHYLLSMSIAFGIVCLGDLLGHAYFGPYENGT